MSHVLCGGDLQFPVLKPKLLLEKFSELGFPEKVLGTPLDQAAATLTSFWGMYQKLFPQHQIFTSGLDLGHTIPYYCHGDGGRTVKKESLMVLSLYSALGSGTAHCPVNIGAKRRREDSEGSPVFGVNLKGHTMANRFLYAAMRTEFYKEKPQVFLDLLDSWGKEMESLFTNGVFIHGTKFHIAVLGLTGDAPFLKQAGNHNRSFLNIRKSHTSEEALVGCCWLCHAGKPDIDFEEVGFNTNWRNTCGANNELPWYLPGPLLLYCKHLESDKASFYRPDVLHIYNLGLSKDFAASSVIYMQRLYDGRSVAAKIANLNQDLRKFIQAKKFSLHCGKLTLDLLGYKSSGDFPCGHWSKGSDSVIIVRFIEWLLVKEQFEAEVREDEILQVILATASAMSSFMRVLFKSGFFVEGERAQVAVRSGHSALLSYRRLAELTNKESLCLFALKPKLHYFNHLVASMYDQYLACGFTVNPISESTYQLEDFVGRTSRLSRRVDPKAISAKTLQRYMVCARGCLVEGEEGEDSKLLRRASLMAPP